MENSISKETKKEILIKAKSLLPNHAKVSIRKLDSNCLLITIKILVELDIDNFKSFLYKEIMKYHNINFIDIKII